jgi:hypothetical protein
MVMAGDEYNVVVDLYNNDDADYVDVDEDDDDDDVGTNGNDR